MLRFAAAAVGNMAVTLACGWLAAVPISLAAPSGPKKCAN
jgi:hypothetical protein